jgi:hypothetical protein
MDRPKDDTNTVHTIISSAQEICVGTVSVYDMCIVHVTILYSFYIVYSTLCEID